MIFLVWFAAVIVSLAPQFGWKDPEYLQRIEEQKCMVSQDVAYQVRAQDTLSLCNIHSYNSHSLPPFSIGFRNLLHLLRSSASYFSAVLENLPNGPQAHPAEKERQAQGGRKCESGKWGRPVE